jgi:hypothetical protein
LGRRAPLALTLSLALSLAGVGCVWFPPLPAPRLDEPWGVYEIDAPALGESSGLVKSRRYPDVFWTHNDSGDAARVFAIDSRGHLLAEFPVEGASHVDWEDIATDDSGHLYLGDFGNNGNRRRDLIVYRVPEPHPAGPERTARVDRTLRFRYADQRAFPDPERLDYDAEAMFWWRGALYIFTKHRSDTRTRVYRLPDRAEEGERALEPLAEIDLGGEPSRLFGNTTGADLSTDGRFVALLTYRAIFLYERRGPDPVPDGPVARIALDPRRTRQAESVAWDGSTLVVGNEQRKLFRIPIPLDPALDRYPPRDPS